MSNTAASSAPDLGEAASKSDEWHHPLVPLGGAGVSNMVRRGVAGVGFPIAVAGWGWLPKGQLGTCPSYQLQEVQEYLMGFGGQAFKAAPQASRKDWQFHPSFSMASYSKSCKFSPRIVVRYGHGLHRQSPPP